MAARKKTIAILTQSPALGSIIAMVLDCEEQFFVQTFAHTTMLKRHARIAPIDLVVCDYQIGPVNAAQLAIDLRQANQTPGTKFIVLSERMDAQIRQACIFSNIDEVIVKPMSPLFLRDRALAQLMSDQSHASHTRDPGRKEQQAKDAPLADNVVYLWGKNHTMPTERHPER